MVFNNHTGWIFFPKIINVRNLISTSGLDFGPKKLSIHCTTIRKCRVGCGIHVNYFVSFRSKINTRSKLMCEFLDPHRILIL